VGSGGDAYRKWSLDDDLGEVGGNQVR